MDTIANARFRDRLFRMIYAFKTSTEIRRKRPNKTLQMNTQNKTDQIMFTKERTRIIYYRIRLNYKDAGKRYRIN